MKGLDGTSSRTTSRPHTVPPHRHRYLRYEPGLDGIRGVSILAVVVFHCSTWLPGGLAALSVFFALSGFLIVTLLIAELDRTGSVDLGRFWGRRIQRLAPAGLLVVAVVLAVSPTGFTGWRSGAVQPIDAIGAIWSFSNWVTVGIPDAEALRALGPFSAYWSLAVEEQFYVAIAAVFLVVRRLQRPMLWLTAVLGACFVVSLALVMMFDRGLSRDQFGTDMRVAEIAAGCLLAVVVARWPGVPRYGSRVWNPVGWVALIGSGATFVYASRTSPWLDEGGFVLLALGTDMMILAILADGSLNRFLRIAPLAYIGRISYAVYVVHWPIRLVATPQRLRIDGTLLALVLIALSLVGGALVHHAVEQPLRDRRVAPLTAAAGWLVASVALTLVATLVLST